MNTTTIQIVQGDYGMNLNFTLQDSNGAAINLTGCTLKLNVQEQQSDILKFAGAMAIDVAASGTCHYAVAQGDFSDAGKYYAEIEITYAGSTEVLTIPNIIIQAIPQIPRE